MAKKKQRYRPFSDKEKEDISYMLESTQAKIGDLKLQEIRFEEGLVNIDKDVDTAIAQTKKELRAIEIKLHELYYDKDYDLTKNRVALKLKEIQKEIEREERNVKALEIQLKQGKPIIEEQNATPGS